MPVSVFAGYTARQTNRLAARTAALESFRWAVEQVASPSLSAQAAGWVMLQTLNTDPSLTAADKRMMEAAKDKLRALGGGTP